MKRATTPLIATCWTTNSISSLHLGDHIHESPLKTAPVRRHAHGELFTLSDYRTHFAQYRSDPDLLAAHAACPWLMVWDDHEVENDYAAAHSQNVDDPSWFLRRRANAYRAYYEHMPPPRTVTPCGPDMRIYTGVEYGMLARFTLMDGREYRSPQPWAPFGRGGANRIENCAARLDEHATLLGAQQEQWFGGQMRSTQARWTWLVNSC